MNHIPPPDALRNGSPDEDRGPQGLADEHVLLAGGQIDPAVVARAEQIGVESITDTPYSDTAPKERRFARLREAGSRVAGFAHRNPLKSIGFTIVTLVVVALLFAGNRQSVPVSASISAPPVNNFAERFSTAKEFADAVVGPLIPVIDGHAIKLREHGKTLTTIGGEVRALSDRADRLGTGAAQSAAEIQQLKRQQEELAPDKIRREIENLLKKMTPMSEVIEPLQRRVAEQDNKLSALEQLIESFKFTSTANASTVVQAQIVELDKKSDVRYDESRQNTQSLFSRQQRQEDDMVRLSAQVATLTAAVAISTATVAQAADMPVKGPPQQAVAACVHVLLDVMNWEKPAVFRVTAVGGKAPGGYVQMRAQWKPGDDSICIPRVLFEAEKIEVCIGDTSKDNSNSRIIQGRWMQIARTNLAKGDVVNPDEPMEFRYNGPSGEQRRSPRPNRYGPHYRRQVGNSQMFTGAALLGTGVIIGRAIGR